MLIPNYVQKNIFTSDIVKVIQQNRITIMMLPDDQL